MNKHFMKIFYKILKNTQKNIKNALPNTHRWVYPQNALNCTFVFTQNLFLLYKIHIIQSNNRVKGTAVNVVYCPINLIIELE